VYVLLIVLVAGTLVGYQHHTNVRFEQFNRIDCAERKVVVANQRLVLRTLLLWAAAFSDRTKVGLAAVPSTTIALLKKRRAQLGMPRCVS
jgi:hypothetical protein